MFRSGLSCPAEGATLMRAGDQSPFPQPAASAADTKPSSAELSGVSRSRSTTWVAPIGRQSWHQTAPGPSASPDRQTTPMSLSPHR
eukprot:5690037-Lingulodinium_polyedra.AAC.1